MRQGQQNNNRRGRGRGRKPQNPLARSYESNGPDVKVRGTAAHIAEKYMSLARDALASGDSVAAESYLQHAEHYNRIIMAAQAQLGPQGQGAEGTNGGGGYRPRWSDGSEIEDDDQDGNDPGMGEEIHASVEHTDNRRRENHRQDGRRHSNGSGAAHDGNGNGNGAQQGDVIEAEETPPDIVS